MAARLPVPGRDDGTWGDILNEYLRVSHGDDGTLVAGSVGTTQLQDGSVTASKLDSATNVALASANNTVQIGGDLGGTSSAPRVAKLNNVALPGMAPSSGQTLVATNAATLGWQAAVTSVANKTGAVQLTAGDVGAQSILAGGTTIWSASTAYTAGTIVKLPDGTMGVVTANTTSRANFDATESAVWQRLGVSNYNYTTTTRLPSPTHLRRIRAALGKATSISGGLCEIVTIGTSLTGGMGSGTARQGTWPMQAQAMLASRGYIAGGEGLILGAANVPDSRVVLTNWSQFSVGGSGLQPIISSSAANATAVFTSAQAATVIELIYWDGGSSWKWSIDGGAATTVTPGSTSVFKRVSIATGLTNATHSVTITANASGAYFGGVIFRQSSGVVVHNIGIAQATTTSALTAGASPAAAYTQAGLATVLAPPLVVIELGSNDGTGGVYPASSGTLKQAAITSLSSTSDIMLITDPARGDVSDSAAAAYAVQIQASDRALAETNDIALVDLYDRLGPFSLQTSLGTTYDTVHFLPAGYAQFARPVVEILTS